MAKKTSKKVVSVGTSFGAFVRDRRQNLGLTLRDLARQIGVDHGNLSKLERGLLDPPRHVGDYAKVLHISEDSADFKKLQELALVARYPEAVASGSGSIRKPGVWTTARQLESWAASKDCETRLPQLVRRLIWATVDSLQHLDFPAGEGVQRPGADGIVHAVTGNAFVPEGVSIWEVSKEDEPWQRKAKEDFEKRTKQLRKEKVPLSEMTFVFLTPRKWQDKEKWIAQKNQLGVWKRVVVFDSSNLEQWLETAPVVDHWMAYQLGLRPDGVRDIDRHWLDLQAMTNPPLSPNVFQASRQQSVNSLRDFLGVPATSPDGSNTTDARHQSVLAFETVSPGDALDFVAAVVFGLETNSRERIQSRIVIVETTSAWRDLNACRNSLILIAAPALGIEPDLIAESVRHGHRVILCDTRFSGDRAFVTVLPPIWPEELCRALIESGVPEKEASRIADDSGGVLTVVKRSSIAAFPSTARPPWSESAAAADLIPILLAGAWDDRNVADQQMMSRLAGQPYGGVLTTATRWLHDRDPVLRRALSSWSLVSRIDSWRLLAPFITRQHLENFAVVVQDVFGSDDPALELSLEDRWQASIHGKSRLYSGDLRKGLSETLALMSVEVTAKCVAPDLNSSSRAQVLVRNILSPNAPWRHWASLGSILPTLAEAAPSEFLDALRRDLDQESPATVQLMHESFGGTPMLNACYHAGLLWALETLAWNKDYLSPVAILLAKLAAHDPGTGNWSKRPLKSLKEIFLPLMPHTTADVLSRIKVLGKVTREFPTIGWKLLMSLLPGGPSLSSPTHRPKWNDWSDKHNRSVPANEYWTFIDFSIDTLIGLLDANPEHVMDVVKNFRRFEHKYAMLWDRLERIDATEINYYTRCSMAQQIRSMVRHQRAYGHDRDTDLSDSLNRLEALAEKFASGSLCAKHAWLFADPWSIPKPKDTPDYATWTQELEDLRRSALKEVISVGGADAVRELADLVNSPRIIGWTLADVAPEVFTPDRLLQYLLSDNALLRAVANGFIEKKWQLSGSDWVQSISFDDWQSEAILAFVVSLPFERKVWGLLTKFSDCISTQYWQTVADCRNCPKDDVVFAISKLLEHRRPFKAAEVLSMAIHNEQFIESETLLRVLEEGMKAGADVDLCRTEKGEIRHSVSEILGKLQSRGNIDEVRLAQLELQYLDCLEEPSEEPKTLLAQLQKSPSLFVKLIQGLFYSRDVPAEDRVPSMDQQRAFGDVAYRLLDRWQKAKPSRIPGMCSDGTINETELFDWVRSVREQLRLSGHLEVGDLRIGELLAHDPEPAAPEEGWPKEAIRDLIESPELSSESMRGGFEMGIYNKRGLVCRSPMDGGKLERDLATKYEIYAAICNDEWPEVADSLRQLAATYKNQAIREDEEARKRFW